MLLFCTRSTAPHAKTMLESSSKSATPQPIRFRQKDEMAESVPERMIRGWAASPSAWLTALVLVAFLAWACSGLLVAAPQ